MRKSLLTITLLLATAYLSLSIAPMACAIDLADRHGAGHHHGGGASHSSFCAWVCQANPASGLVSTGSPLGPVCTVVVLLTKQEVVAPYRSDHFSVSRGPPSAFPLS